MITTKQGQRAQLLDIARRAMLARGLSPDFPPEAVAEANRVVAPETPDGKSVHDLRDLAWCSIDNDDSRDLDQLTWAGRSPGGDIRTLVAIADVSASVGPTSALDGHAAINTRSLYTPARTFPMLPERLSHDLTSLVAGEDRLALVVEIRVADDAPAGAPEVYRAVVRNHARLTYGQTGPWLESRGAPPPEVAAAPRIAESLRLQDDVARQLRSKRHQAGALELESIEVRASFEDDRVSGLVAEERNRARDLIEDFMIATNGAIARFLVARRFPVLRRVVRTPERWSRIVDIAAHLGERLPGPPDAGALHDFLVRRREADPLRFPDLSLSVIKLLGRGVYEASQPGDEIAGHFGLAVSDYTHSTAPNRRYPDLLTQRLLRAAVAGDPVPYSPDELRAIATSCTRKEDDVHKVERLTRKAAAACLLDGRIGEEFDGVVTGASDKGTWVRVLDPPVEGRVEQGASGLDVGDRVRVKLIGTDVERGFIDFARTGHDPVGPRREAVRRARPAGQAAP